MENVTVLNFGEQVDQAVFQSFYMGSNIEVIQDEFRLRHKSALFIQVSDFLGAMSIIHSIDWSSQVALVLPEDSIVAVVLFKLVVQKMIGGNMHIHWFENGHLKCERLTIGKLADEAVTGNMNSKISVIVNFGQRLSTTVKMPPHNGGGYAYVVEAPRSFDFSYSNMAANLVNRTFLVEGLIDQVQRNGDACIRLPGDAVLACAIAETLYNRTGVWIPILSVVDGVPGDVIRL